MEAVLTKYEMTNAEGMTEKGLKRLREKQQGHLRDSLVRKKFHRVHQTIHEEDETDKAGSCRWLTMGKLNPSTEALVQAMQDGTVRTAWYRATIYTQSARDVARKMRRWATS